MSQIENSRICSITRSSSVNANQGDAENHPTDSPNPFLKTPLRSIYNFKTTSEKRNTFALQSRKASSDGRVVCSAQSDDSLPSGAFAHSGNKSTFEFWQHLHQRGNEQNLNEELSRVIPANSPQAVEHLQSAISNVNLEAGTPSDNNNGMLTYSQLEKVAQKVESVHCESGEEVSNVEVRLPGTRDSVSAATDASGIEEETAASLQILSASKQESQNLRPILKRKEAPVWSIPQALVPSLPPPILKKRDSLSECHVSDCQSTVNNAQTVPQSAKPASILKNRQPRGSYSFDENISSGDLSNQLEDGTHLKPILKKKSWSIDEKVAVSVTNFYTSECVKGILKSSSDKLAAPTSSSSSSRKNSAAEECLSVCYSLPSSATTSAQSKSPSKTALKGILKAFQRSPSESISPCSSSESLSDEHEMNRVPLSPMLIRSAFRREEYLEDKLMEFPQDSTASDSADNDDSDLLSGNTDRDMNEHTSTSVSLPIIATPKPPACNDIQSPNSSVSSSESPQFVNRFSLHSVPASSTTSCSQSAVSAESTTEESQSSLDQQDSDQGNLSMNLTVFRRKNVSSNDAAKSRPKSCFVTANELDQVEASSSIARRLALLKQNGEEGWKNRVSKSDVQKEIQANPKDDEVQLRPKKLNAEAVAVSAAASVGARGGGSVIANRLSCLMESQAQWRSRVNESDAKQFTVASKQSRQSTEWSAFQSTIATSDSESNMDPPEKVVLRGTPKRLGLRGSTLNESALSAVSSKLNNVLQPNKSLLSSPLTPFRKMGASSCTVDSQPLVSPVKLSKPALANCSSIDTSAVAQTVFLTRPDDEESFGSFYGLDISKLDHLLKQEAKISEPRLLSLDSVATESSSLLTQSKRSRVQAPKRRAASSKNPIKQLNKSSISVDSYSHSKMPNSPDAVSGVGSSVTSAAKVDQLARNQPNMAISALAGLASKEDFKNVATKLRSSSINSPASDAWRQHDLRNSIQSRMLILVKGRRHAQIRLIEPSWRSLNLADSFILATKDTVFAFIGPFSNIIERTKCIEVAEQIRKRREICYRSLSSELVLIDGHLEAVRESLFPKVLPILKELDFTDADKAGWDKLLASSSASGTSVDEDDEFYEESLICTNMIFEAVHTEAKDTVDMTPVEQYWGRSPRHQLLQADSAFVFDFGTEMYIWVGKNVSNVHRKKAVDLAKDMWLKGYDYSEIDMSPFGAEATLKAEKRPDWAWFTRVNQNMEPILFKDKFYNWPAFTLTRSVKKKAQRSSLKCDTKDNSRNTQPILKKDLSEEFNLFALDAKEEMVNKSFQEPNLVLENVSLGRGRNDIILDDDGLSVKIISLEVQCFYIDDSGERVELSEFHRNCLFTGESYYIRWKYRLTRISRCLKTGGESKHSEEHGGRDRIAYFVWQGKDASNTQRGATALNAIDKLREEGASQEFIENGKEFPAFLRIFNGSLVVLLGKRGQSASHSKYRMFALKGSQACEQFLVEVECSLRNLRSRSSFIFVNAVNSKVVFIWHGCKASESMRKMTKQFLEDKLLASKSIEFGFSQSPNDQYDLVEVEEGKEGKDFFAIISGSSESSSPKRNSRSNLQREIYFSLLDDSRRFNFTPRLFHFTTSASRIFQVTELVSSYMASRDCNTILEYPFTQEDLYIRASTRPTFFLFDNFYEVFLWESKFPFFILGANKDAPKGSNQVDTPTKPRMIDIETEILSEANLTTGSLAHLWLAERKCALETTLAYCHAKNASEPPTAYVISAGLEPPSFCGLFPTWTYFENVAQLHIEDGRKPGQQILVQEVLAQIRDIHTSTYSYEVLKGRPLPEGINVLCLESYLDDAEFEKIFGFNREEFYALSPWKQTSLKKQAELF